MKVQKTTVNRIVVVGLFVLGLGAVVYGTSVLVRMVTPYAYDQTRYLAQALVGIAWVLSWTLRGVYASSRDLAFSDMGPIALKIFIAEMLQVYENRYGVLTAADLETAKQLKS